MALSKAENQVTWSATNSASVSAGSSQTSDVITLNAACFKASISLKADNSTTAGSTDQIYMWLLQTSGDPDGTGSDEYDSSGHALLLGILDTNSEDPALMTVDYPTANKSAKLYAEGATAGTANAITVSATITEQRA